MKKFSLLPCRPGVMGLRVDFCCVVGHLKEGSVPENGFRDPFVIPVTGGKRKAGPFTVRLSAFGF